MGDRIRSDGHMCSGSDHTPRPAHPALPMPQRRRDHGRVLAGAASHQVTSGVDGRRGDTNSAKQG